jgi:ketosteroid isomerase-like protein
MSAINDVDTLIEQFHLAQGEFAKGNPEPVMKLCSHREDITLANPLGPPVRGWEQVARISELAASSSRGGEMVAFEIISKVVTPELAYVVEIERGKVKLQGREDFAPVALRATMIFRPEDGVWKIVHRHADPLITAQPVESVIQK